MVIQFFKLIPYLNEIDKVYSVYSPREMIKSECAYYLMPKEDCLPEYDVWFTERKLVSSHLRYSITRLSVVEDLLIAWFSK